MKLKKIIKKILERKNSKPSKPTKLCEPDHANEITNIRQTKNDYEVQFQNNLILTDVI